MTMFAQPAPRTLSADGLLTCAYLAGNESAFEVLYRRYYRDALRLARASVRDHALAEDIAQEAMARALRYLHTYDPTQPFWPWLRQITRSVVASEMGRRSSETPVDALDRDDAALPDSSEHVVLKAAVVESMRLLPGRQRDALLLRYLADRDPNDIASAFGLSRNALEQLLLRGRTNFAREYHARNAGMIPVIGPLVARLRRVVSTAVARLQVATGSTMSVAGDVAIGAALTVGTIAVTAGALGNLNEAPEAKTKTLPILTDRNPERGQPDARRPDVFVDRRAGVPAGPGDLVDMVPGGAPTTAWQAPQAQAQPRPKPEPKPSYVVDEPQPGTVPKAEVEAKHPDTPPLPPPPSPPPGPGAEGTLPEPYVDVDDDDGATVGVEDSASNSGAKTSAKKDPTQKGEVINTSANVNGTEVPILVWTNTSDDGLACLYFGAVCD